MKKPENKAATNNLKVKYVLGIFRDLPGYPSLEDFYYLIHKWYFEENGEHFIHEYRGIPFQGKIIFPSQILEEKIGDKTKYNKLLKTLLDEKIIEVSKETKFTTYYEIVDETKLEQSS